MEVKAKLIVTFFFAAIILIVFSGVKKRVKMDIYLFFILAGKLYPRDSESDWSFIFPYHAKYFRIYYGMFADKFNIDLIFVITVLFY